MFYRAHGRHLPWRETKDPYRILVSEIMLQQTQVERVRAFYEKFVKIYPDFKALASAKKLEVLRLWQGLGYNRRALALHRLAEIVMRQYSGKLPHSRDLLESLPGMGPYTAGAIRTFAFDEPEIFIETNIRRAFIHFFFPKRKKVNDKEILPLIKKTLDCGNPRDWYFALMDYGTMLGANGRENPNSRSAHYVRQSKFKGSDREIRGKILRLALGHRRVRIEKLEEAIPEARIRIAKTLNALSREGFLKQEKDTILL